MLTGIGEIELADVDVTYNTWFIRSTAATAGREDDRNGEVTKPSVGIERRIHLVLQCQGFGWCPAATVTGCVSRIWSMPIFLTTQCSSNGRGSILAWTQ